VFEVTAAERRGWRLQRIGWVLMGAVIVLAAAGGLGAGPLSRRTIESGGVRLEYEAIDRVGHSTAMSWSVSTSAGSVRLSLDSTMLAVFDIESWVPAPARSEATTNGIDLFFSVATNNPVAIRMRAMPVSPGRFTPRVKAAPGGPWIPLPVTVLP